MTARSMNAAFWFLLGSWFPNAIEWSVAADLPAAAPPTSWEGYFWLIGFVILLVCAGVVGYAVHVKQTPGKQLGEDEIEAIASALHLKMNNEPPAPETMLHIFDGRTFESEADLAEYKAAKEVIAKYNTGATP